MIPEVLLRSLCHCFIKMESISLLIFDECHHAQVQSNHAYTQIMKVRSSQTLAWTTHSNLHLYETEFD